MSSYRKTWLEINLVNLYKNYLLAKQYSNGKEVIPVIKANAYGHGDYEVMDYLYQKGVRVCAVSLLEEAVNLRKHFDDLKIIVLGPVLKEDLKTISKANLDMTIYNEEILNEVINYQDKLNVHLKIDTGMSRYGLNDEAKIIKAVETLQNLSNIDLVGIYTHLAIVDENEDYLNKQLTKIEKIVKSLKKRPKMVHVSNSSATFTKENTFDYTTHVRLGISLYGLTLNPKTPPLYPVMKLYTTIMQIHKLSKGDCVGYGASYCAKDVEYVAVLPLGYGDGFLRRNENSSVEINNKRYNLVGRVCMDACFVLVDKDTKVNDKVTIFGGLVSIDEVAKYNNTINYEITTNMNLRVERKYIK